MQRAILRSPFAVTAKESASQVFSAWKSRGAYSNTRVRIRTHEQSARARFDIAIYVDANVNGVVNSSTQGCGLNEAAASKERFGRLQPMWFAAKLFSPLFLSFFSTPFFSFHGCGLYEYTNMLEEVSRGLTRNYITITARTVISPLVLRAGLQGLTVAIAIPTLCMLFLEIYICTYVRYMYTTGDN